MAGEGQAALSKLTVTVLLHHTAPVPSSVQLETWLTVQRLVSDASVKKACSMERCPAVHSSRICHIDPHRTNKQATDTQQGLAPAGAPLTQGLRQSRLWTWAGKGLSEPELRERPA